VTVRVRDRELWRTVGDKHASGARRVDLSSRSTIMTEKIQSPYVLKKSLQTPAHISSLAFGHTVHLFAGSGKYSGCYFRQISRDLVSQWNRRWNPTAIWHVFIQGAESHSWIGWRSHLDRLLKTTWVRIQRCLVGLWSGGMDDCLLGIAKFISCRLFASKWTHR